MADPNGPFDYRTRDSDNDLLRKILNWFNALFAGTKSILVRVAELLGAAFIDKSGTIAVGGTSQVVSAALNTRRYLVFQNHSDTDMWINFGTAAVAGQPSVKIFANGGAYEPLVAPFGSINVICATGGKTFTCKEA